MWKLSCPIALFRKIEKEIEVNSKVMAEVSVARLICAWSLEDPSCSLHCTVVDFSRSCSSSWGDHWRLSHPSCEFQRNTARSESECSGFVGRSVTLAGCCTCRLSALYMVLPQLFLPIHTHSHSLCLSCWLLPQTVFICVGDKITGGGSLFDLLGKKEWFLEMCCFGVWFWFYVKPMQIFTSTLKMHCILVRTRCTDHAPPCKKNCTVNDYF